MRSIATKYILGFSLLFVLLSSCSIKPSGVLSQRQMVDVLFDIHKADATISVTSPYRTAADNREYYNRVFAKWNVTKENFDRSLEWYATRPDDLLDIYDSVRVRADNLQLRVEAYEFHPKDKPTLIDSLDEFDLWKWQRVQFLENRGQREILPDSLRFAYNDSNYFARGNELNFRLEMTTHSLDTATFRTMLVLHYADSTRDTLSHTSLSDGVERKYHYTKTLPDTVALAQLDVILVDEPFWLTDVEVKTVSLHRKYHKFNSPVMPEIRTQVRNSRDSVTLARKKLK